MILKFQMYHDQTAGFQNHKIQSGWEGQRDVPISATPSCLLLILIILKTKVPLMLHTKIQPKMPSGSVEKGIGFAFFTVMVAIVSRYVLTI